MDWGLSKEQRRPTKKFSAINVSLKSHNWSPKLSRKPCSRNCTKTHLLNLLSKTEMSLSIKIGLDTHAIATDIFRLLNSLEIF